MHFDNKQVQISAAVILAALLLWWGTNLISDKPVQSGSAEKNSPDYLIEDFSTNVIGVNGKRKYTLKAKRLTSLPFSATLDLLNPYLIQYEGLQEIHTRANTGELAKDRTKIVMKGNVRIAQDRKFDETDNVQINELTIYLKKN